MNDNQQQKDCRTAADYIRPRLKKPPKIGIILGTALGSLANEITVSAQFPYREIPGFLQATAPSHAGLLINGSLAGQDVVCMSGRFHYYEGYSFAQLAAPIQLFKLLGVQLVIITNAAGAINLSYRPGDLMLISDHLNFMGAAPTRGPNPDEFGPRFFDVSHVYAPELRLLAKEVAGTLGTGLHEGVYAYMTGPQFETPAEIRALRTLGADAVGMSTVPEALAAAHCGLPVLGISVLTNMASGILPVDAPISQVEEIGNIAAADLATLIKGVLSALP
ncbi:MAG: purine-nucleoside phosphorylase [Saccharofermentanales bacterium]|jgi:purine-nucleoside phosphorylase|nr:purine-nucleoside phosphorylase [Bacillota bacterium]NLB09196.1 purine-nucleoside phosphorylase [Clostridiales bacterium]